MEIETHYCEFCYKPLMQSNIVGWNCKNEQCILNNL